jgi:hypothetical protein
MYIAVFGGGMWRSADGGANFTNIHNVGDPDNHHNMTDCTPDGKTLVNVQAYLAGHVFYHTSADVTDGSTGWGKITNATVGNGKNSLRKMLLSRDGRTIVVNAGDESNKMRISTNYADGWTTWSDFMSTSYYWVVWLQIIILMARLKQCTLLPDHRNRSARFTKQPT